MDLGATIVYNGLTASGASGPAGGAPWRGITINKVDISDFDVEQYFAKRAVQDGADAADVYLGARRIGIEAAVQGSTRGDTFDQVASFLAAYDPVLAYNSDTASIGFLPFQYFRPTADISTWPTSTYPNGIPLQVYARPLSPPRYVIDRQASGGVAANSFVIPMQATLIAKDPRQYNQASISVTLSTATATAVYRGNFPTWPIVTVAMSAAGDASQQFTIAGGTIQINLSSTSSGTYTIRYSDRTIKNESDALVTSLFDTSYAQVFKQIESGSTMYASGTTGMSSVSVTYREAFT